MLEQIVGQIRDLLKRAGAFDDRVASRDQLAERLECNDALLDAALEQLESGNSIHRIDDELVSLPKNVRAGSTFDRSACMPVVLPGVVRCVALADVQRVSLEQRGTADSDLDRTIRLIRETLEKLDAYDERVITRKELMGALRGASANTISRALEQLVAGNSLHAWGRGRYSLPRRIRARGQPLAVGDMGSRITIVRARDGKKLTTCTIAADVLSG